MKHLITLCLILTSFSVGAYEMPLKTVSLDKEKLYLEDFLVPEEDGSAHNQIQLRRTSDTPDSVQIGFAIMTDGFVCVKYRSTNAFRRDEYYDNRLGRSRSYLLHNDCIEAVDQPLAANKWVTLDFDKAKKLKKGDQEFIIFSASQEDFVTEAINLDAKVIDATGVEENYSIVDIEEGFFTDQGLDFISNSINPF